MSSENTMKLVPAGSLNPDDDWHAVEDKKERKKIQDRLAQRARRRRIAESKQKERDLSATPEIGGVHPVQMEMELVTAVAPANLLSTAEYHLLPRRFMSALTALFNNGFVLGLPVLSSCSMGITQINPTAPESLQPTSLQLSVMHYSTIDRFPFPVFRNNLILMQDSIDPQEFIYDIINMHSFWVVDDRPPWDQTAWRMGKDYEKKWGFLFLGDGKSATTLSAGPSMSYTVPTTTAY